MKSGLLLLLAVAFCMYTHAQQNAEVLVSPNENLVSPAGIQPSDAHFVPVVIEKGECISQEQREKARARIEENIELIRQTNPEALKITSASVELIKPVQAAAGFSDYGFFTLNFQVDHNLTPGNNLLDYHCGQRTYDWTTGNHQGTDYILWPYPWKNMENNIMEIVSAADGIIVDRRNGYPDKNCANDGNPYWNGIVLQHSDGSQTWYLHFKNGSITPKLVGEQVSAGEYLGTAGSSGSSNWPHLHFEVRAAGNALIDPYAGSCNDMNSASWWADQPDYYVRTINRISTHYTIEHDNNCPQVEETYEELNFNAGDLFVMKLFYRDIQQGDVTNIRIIAPNNTTWMQWDWAQNWGYDYATAHAYWTLNITNAWPQGVYTLQATFGGQVYETLFGIGTNLPVNNREHRKFTLYPNPASSALVVESPHLIKAIHITDATGRKVMQSLHESSSASMDVSKLPAGTYFIQVDSESGSAADILRVVR